MLNIGLKFNSNFDFTYEQKRGETDMKLEDLPKYTRVCGPIRELLGLKSAEEFTIVVWNRPEETPELGSFLLLKLLDTDGSSIICEGEPMRTGGT